MPIGRNPPLLIDLRDVTLDMGEPGLRVIDASTREHVASILPDANGFYDSHCWRELAAMIRLRDAKNRAPAR